MIVAAAIMIATVLLLVAMVLVASGGPGQLWIAFSLIIVAVTLIVGISNPEERQ